MLSAIAARKAAQAASTSDEEPMEEEPQPVVPQSLLQEINSSPAPGTLLVLLPKETICIAGTYQLTILQGTVSFLGTKLRASSKAHHVFAPKSSPLPVMEAVSLESSILTADTSRRLGLVDIRGAVILLQELRTGVQGLGRVCKVFSGVFDFRHEEACLWKEKVIDVAGAYVLRSEEVHYETYTLPKSWGTALENMDPPSTGGIYLVKGPKKTGKSTFARTMLNCLLTRFERVAYLECDPGQSEFSPGGMVALNVVQDFCFGPPFTHPTVPAAAHYIGATTPRSSPAHYLASIQALFHTYELDVCNPFLPSDSRMDASGDYETSPRISNVIPLIVNTMGWHKGLGADLNRRIQEIVQPTHVFDFRPEELLDNYDDPVYGAEQKSQFYVQLDPFIPSPTSPLHTQYTAADHRVINTLSYLHATFPSPSSERAEPPVVSLQPISATSWRTGLPLCSQPPYAVNWQTALDRIVLTGNGSEDVIPACVGDVLNGALVGIVASWGDDRTVDVEIPEETRDQEPDTNISTYMPYVQGAPVPAPASSTCLGLALIRSVSHCSPPAAPHHSNADVEKELHVLTPVPLPLLEHGRIFVKGEMELPVWGMLDFSGGEDGWKSGVAGVEWGKVPYLQWGKGEGLGAERRRVRRNLMRKAQM